MALRTVDESDQKQHRQDRRQLTEQRAVDHARLPSEYSTGTPLYPAKRLRDPATMPFYWAESDTGRERHRKR